MVVRFVNGQGVKRLTRVSKVPHDIDIEKLYTCTDGSHKDGVTAGATESMGYYLKRYTTIFGGELAGIAKALERSRMIAWGST